MIVFTVVSTKGGVGKTTIAANISALLADLGFRVLMIDADVQPSLTRYFPIMHRAPHGITEVVKRGVISQDCISNVGFPSSDAGRLNPNGCLDLVVSDAPEGALQDWLAQRMDRAVRMKKALRSPFVAENYDVVLIDTQGAVGHLQDTAVLAADLLISPVSPDIISAREFTTGTLDLLKKLETAEEIGMSVPPMQVVIYKLEKTRDSRSIADTIRKEHVTFRGRVNVLRTVIPHAVAYKNAATAQLPVHWINPDRAGLTMHDLVWELIPSLQNVVAEACQPFAQTVIDPLEGEGESAAEVES